MKTCVLAITIGFMVSSQYASGCGGSGGVRLSGGKVARGGGVPLVAAAPSFNPMMQAVAMQSGQFSMARQTAVAQANAYNARMHPIRLAKANRIREQRLAFRNARKEIRIAKLEAQRQQEREFLVKARTWTDSTGNHEIVAILADANAWGVKLQKKDGSTVNVPMEKLSSPDQTMVASVIANGIDNGVMLAGL